MRIHLSGHCGLILAISMTCGLQGSTMISDILSTSLYAKKIPYAKTPRQGHKLIFCAAALNLKKFNTKVQPCVKVLKHLKPRSIC